MHFEQIPIGGDRNFSYLVADEQTRDAAVIDCGYNPERLAELASRRGFNLRYLLATHSHFDHVDGLGKLKELSGAPIAAHRLAAGKIAVDQPLEDGQVLALGQVRLRIIFCPGHCEDSIAILIDDEVLCSGDELFVGKIGGTRTAAQARQQFDSLHQKLLTLPDPTKVFPGHDVGERPSSTIGDERRTNPFLTRTDFDDFLWLKENWAAYKAEHGIK